MSLLEEAKKVEPKRRGETKFPLDEMLDLALAFAKDEITGNQIVNIIGGSMANAYNQMYRALMRAAREGLIEIKKK